MKGARALGLGLLLVVSLARFAYEANVTRVRGFADFPVFWMQLRFFRETGVLYPQATDLGHFLPDSAVYTYPPLFAMLILPFVEGAGDPEASHVGESREQLRNTFRRELANWPSATLRPAIVGTVWAIELAIYLLFVAVVLGWLVPNTSAAVRIVLACCALNYEPFFETLYGLQLEIPLLALIALAYLAARRNRDALAGSLLGICTMLKLYPAILLTHFLLQRRWAAVGGFVAAVVGVLLAAAVWLGVDENVSYFARVLPAMLAWGPVATSENLALGQYLQTIVGLSVQAAEKIAGLVALVLTVWSVVMIQRASSGRLRPREDRDLGFLLLIPLMLLSLVNSWMNYQLLLLLPILVMAARCARQRRHGVALALAGAYVLTSFSGNPPSMTGIHLIPEAVRSTLSSARGASNLIVWLSLLSLMYGSERAREEEDRQTARRLARFGGD